MTGSTRRPPVTPVSASNEIDRPDASRASNTDKCMAKPSGMTVAEITTRALRAGREKQGNTSDQARRSHPPRTKGEASSVGKWTGAGSVIEPIDRDLRTNRTERIERGEHVVVPFAMIAMAGGRPPSGRPCPRANVRLGLEEERSAVLREEDANPGPDRWQPTGDCVQVSVSKLRAWNRNEVHGNLSWKPPHRDRLDGSARSAGIGWRPGRPPTSPPTSGS